MGVRRRGRRPDLVGAVMALMIIVRCGLNCRKMQGAGIGKELGVLWVIRRGTSISSSSSSNSGSGSICSRSSSSICSSSSSICRGHDRDLSGLVFLPSGDSGVEIDWV